MEVSSATEEAPTESSSSTVLPLACQVSAAYRALETLSHRFPLLRDHLSSRLAGQRAVQLVAGSFDADGPGGETHSSVAARAVVVDRLIEQAAACVSGKRGLTLGTSSDKHDAQLLQVVCLCCGMDTRPWRMNFVQNVTWFDLDQEHILNLKLHLLHQAGAEAPTGLQTDRAQARARQVSPLVWTNHRPGVGHTVSSSCVAADELFNNMAMNRGNGGFVPDPSDSESESSESAFDISDKAIAPLECTSFPLLCSRYTAVHFDVTSSATSWVASLTAAGYSAEQPTIWVLEGFLQSLTVAAMTSLLEDLAVVSLPGSWLIATQTVQKRGQCVLKGASLVHSSLEDLVDGTLVETCGWKLMMLPVSVRDFLKLDESIPAVRWAESEMSDMAFTAVYKGHNCG